MAKKGAKEERGGPKGAQNRRARYDYHIEEEHEAGIVLVGSEVKSLYEGMANLTDGYALVKNGELWLVNLDIEPYDRATAAFLQERRRDRKLLMHRKEIETLERKAREKNYTIIPLELYFKGGKVKLKIGLGRGKKDYDKRANIAEKETKREAARVRAGKRE